MDSWIEWGVVGHTEKGRVVSATRETEGEREKDRAGCVALKLLRFIVARTGLASFDSGLLPLKRGAILLVTSKEGADYRGCVIFRAEDLNARLAYPSSVLAAPNPLGSVFDNDLLNIICKYTGNTEKLVAHDFHW